MNKKNILLITLVALIALAARLLPHVPNFSPMAAVMLFAGVYASSKKYLILPLIALFVSDLFLGFYKWEIMASVYGSLVVAGLLGLWLKSHKNILNIASLSLASALIFFLVTNFAVWYFGTWYSHNLAGLALAYSLAIPFFKSTLASNLVYSALLFGVWEYMSYKVKEKRLITEQK